LHRITEPNQGAKCRLCVLLVRTDEQIKILCGSGLRMHSKRMRADDKVFNYIRVESAKEILKVFRHHARIAFGNQQQTRRLIRSIRRPQRAVHQQVGASTDTFPFPVLRDR